jgi:catechol-2,3-dioxygenase
MSERLRGLGALTGASDHGVSKSLYGRDPDGNEFEVMWEVPREAWGRFEDEATVMPLNLEAELKRWGAGNAESLTATLDRAAGTADGRAPLAEESS